MNVGIFVYDNAEVLDFSGPFEVFSTANRLSEPKGFYNPFLVAEKHGAVNGRGGYSVNPKYDFNNHPKIDLLIVAGGVHCEQLKKPRVIDWVSTTASSATLVASVCTGAFLLAEAGLLSNLEVTTHWEDINDLRAAYANLKVIEARRWVDQGKYITSGGISAGIDMSLHLVSKSASLALAENTAQQMAFEWRRNS